MPAKVGFAMIWLFADDDRGSVVIDWVTLTAGILLLGGVVVYSVLGNSAGYLMDEFDDLNKQYQARADDINVSSQAATGTPAEALTIGR
jgi:hypothetical protein